MISDRLILRGRQTLNRCSRKKRHQINRVPTKYVRMPILILLAAVIGQALDHIHENKINVQMHKLKWSPGGQGNPSSTALTKIARERNRRRIPCGDCSAVSSRSTRCITVPALWSSCTPHLHIW